MKLTRRHKITSKPNDKRIRIIIVLVFGVIATSLLIYTQAATNTSSVEPEAGVLSGPAATFSDASASGGQGIKFGGSSSTGAFTHPGVLMDQQQLDFMKAKVSAGEQPWKNAFDQMRDSNLANKNYVARPVPKLMCSPGSVLQDAPNTPQAGCVEMNTDSGAAYTQALMWYVTGDVAHANKAIEIMNAWSNTLQEIPYDQPRHTGPSCNGCAVYWQNLLVAGWSAETMTRAAEIMRYTHNGWSAADITKFEQMLKTKFYPLISNTKETQEGTANGGQTWAEALVNIGVFTNDRAIFDQGIKWWRGLSKTMVYVSRDGAQPGYPKNWQTNTPMYIDTPSELLGLWRNPTSYINGLASETCRDIGHTYMGLGPMANTAETARIQGMDLYGDAEYQDRFLAGFELNAGYVNQLLDRMAATGLRADQVTSSGWKPTGFPCPKFSDGGTSLYIGHVLAYNHFANRKGIPMPNTKKAIDRIGPRGGSNNHLYWETLTHTSAP